MTKAIFKQHSHVFRVHVDGHATGNDVACTAASMLTYTLLMCVMAEDDAGSLINFKNEIDEKAGTFFLRVSVKPEFVSKVSVMIGTIAAGFTILANKYPEHVTVEFFTPIHDEAPPLPGVS